MHAHRFPDAAAMARAPAERRGSGGVIANVQALRALAALLVVLLHCAPLLVPLGISHGQLEFCAAGVDLFFVISGFIMVHTTIDRPVSGLSFLENRIARLVPLYWLFTLLLFAAVNVAPQLFGRPDSSPLNLLRSLLFIPYARADGIFQPVLFLGWSLNYEMFFYALFALSLTVARGGRSVMLAIGAILIIVGLGGLWPSAPGWVRFLTRPIMLEFAAGMGIALVLRRAAPAGAATAPAVAMLVVGLVLLLGHAAFGSEQLSLAGRLVGATLIVSAAVLLERQGHRFRQPTVLKLGDASYSLYLVHPFATQPVTMLAFAVGAPFWLALPLAFIAACMLGRLVHLHVEQPLAKATRRLLDVRRPAAPARGL